MQKTLTVVDLTAIRANAERIKRLASGSAVFAVVKADAYGHGAEEVARAVEDIVDGFCTAIIDEGAALRIAGITKPVLVFTPPMDGADAARASAYSLTVTVNSVETAKLCKGLSCHIKVNTGMNRLGCNLESLPEILKTADAENIEGVYSHLYAPHDSGASFNQLKIFERAVRLVKTYRPQATAHLSASGGLLRGGKFLFDAVRTGILLYGYAPYGFSGENFTPAMKVYAKKIQDTEFIGGGVGYTKAVKNYKNLASYRCGYAEGFKRGVPLGEATLCMDSFISKKQSAYICVMENAEAYAKRCNTISYEVLTSVTKRSEITYKR